MKTALLVSLGLLLPLPRMFGAAPVAYSKGLGEMRVKLAVDRDAKLEIPSDLAAVLKDTQARRHPGIAPDIKSLEMISAALKNDPGLLNRIETEYQITGTGAARVVNVTAPSAAILLSGTAPLSEAERKIVMRYSSVFLQTQALAVLDKKAAAAAATEFVKVLEEARDVSSRRLVDAVRDRTPGHERRFQEALSTSGWQKKEALDVVRIARVSQQTGPLMNKITFGAEDVFLAEDYDRIMGELVRVVGFYGSGRLDLIGVGILVGPRLVLTCEHVVAARGFETATPRSFSKPLIKSIDREYRIVGVVQHGKDDSTNPDLALVEVELKIGDPIVNLPPLPVSSAPVRNKPICVLAMHRNSVSLGGIYDSAAVLFPAQTKGAELNKLYNEILLSVRAREYAGSIDQVRAEMLLVDFEQSYGVSMKEVAAGETYYYRRKYDNDHVVRRVFGFGTDTVEGNSGGGVFNKLNGRLVGMMSRGVSGKGTEHQADWMRHELGVPGETVNQFLELYVKARGSNPALPEAFYDFKP